MDYLYNNNNNNRLHFGHIVRTAALPLPSAHAYSDHRHRHQQVMFLHPLHWDFVSTYADGQTSHIH